MLRHTHYLLIIFVVAFGDDHKRLLLNDQTVLNGKYHQLELKIQSLESQMLQLRKGAVYTRWGRKSCPGNGTELVYTGIAGGGDYDHSGAASDYVCLPHDPNLITNTAIQNPWGESSFMYGGEYEDNILGTKLFDNDVPCAVCYTTHQSVILMIPGRNKCYDGWKTEYFGKLVGGSYRAPSASQYACLDNYPEGLEHGSANENGKLFYAVRARCGSLPCPPYTNNALLTCVVCSK